MAKPSEDTLTTIFKEILVKNGIDAEAFMVWDTPVGMRKPDILCRNDKFYPLEAKIKEEDIIKDIIKIQNDYFKYSKELNIGGAFILKHPNPKRLKWNVSDNKLRQKFRKATFQLILLFPQDDERQFEKKKGKLDELIPIINDTINYKRIQKELDPETAIDVLRNVTKYLDRALDLVTMDILISSMGGMELFEDLLEINNVKPDMRTIRTAISFFILTQLLFYRVVSQYKKKELEPLDNISRTNELNTKYFEKIKDVNYRAIFGIDIVSNLPDTTVPFINAIIDTLEGLRPENIKGDLIGTIFHDLIPFDIRKRVAAYYTNIMATELLANLSIESHKTTVADFACGSGGLLVAAYRRKKKLLEDTRKFTSKDHEKFIAEDIYGIDIMPFASNIASCNLALQAPQFFTNRVNIGLWDSIDLKPGDMIPEFATLKFLFRSKTMDAWLSEETQRRITDLKAEDEEIEEFLVDKRDLVIMNPPFTRHERLPKFFKERIRQRFFTYWEKGIYNEKMGLHGVFILLGDLFLNEGGILSLVLPASILARKSFHKLRQLIIKRYNVELIVYNTSRLNFSESTLWREILLILKKQESKKKMFRLIRLKEFPEKFEEANTIANSIRNGKESEKFEIIKIEQGRLAEMEDWSSITIASDLIREIYNILSKHDRVVLLRPKFACIRSDLEHYKTDSGLSCFIQNSFREESGQLKEDWLGINTTRTHLQVKHLVIEKAKVNIPLSRIKRAFRTTSNVRVMNVDDKLGYLLVGGFKDYKDKFLRYIFNQSKIKSFRADEFNKILSNFERRRARIHLNRRLYLTAPGTSYVAFCSKTPFIAVDTWGFYDMSLMEAKLMALWFNSTFGLIQLLMVGAAIEGNWMKVHKYMLERFYIPEPENFIKDFEQEITDLYDDVSTVVMPSLVEQLRIKSDVRKRVDRFFIERLNIEIWRNYGGLNAFLELLQEELLQELKGLCPTDFT